MKAVEQTFSQWQVLFSPASSFLFPLLICFDTRAVNAWRSVGDRLKVSQESKQRKCNYSRSSPTILSGMDVQCKHSVAQKKAHIYIDHLKLAGCLEGLEFWFVFLVLLKHYGPDTCALFRHYSYSFWVLWHFPIRRARCWTDQLWSCKVRHCVKFSPLMADWLCGAGVDSTQWVVHLVFPFAICSGWKTSAGMLNKLLMISIAPENTPPRRFILDFRWRFGFSSMSQAKIAHNWCKSTTHVIFYFYSFKFKLCQ